MNNSSNEKSYIILERSQNQNEYEEVYYFSTLIPKENRFIEEFIISCSEPRICLIGIEKIHKCIVWASNPEDKVPSGFCLIEILVEEKNGGNFLGSKFIFEHFFKVLKLTQNITVNQVSYILTTSFEGKISDKRLLPNTLNRLYNVKHICEIIRRNMTVKLVSTYKTIAWFEHFPRPSTMKNKILKIGTQNDVSYDELVFRHLKKNASSIIGTRNEHLFKSQPESIRLSNKKDLFLPFPKVHFNTRSLIPRCNGRDLIKKLESEAEESSYSFYEDKATVYKPLERNSKRLEIISDNDSEEIRTQFCNLSNLNNECGKIETLKFYTKKNNKPLELKEKCTNIPSDSISSGFSDLIVHDETTKNHIDAENGEINSPFQWSTVEEITPIDEKICCLNKNNSENHKGHLLKDKDEKPCINPNIDDALLNDEVNSTGTIKSNSFLKAGILKQKSRRMNDFCDNESFNKTSHFLGQNNLSNKLNSQLLNSASNDDICSSLIIHSENISLLRGIPNKGRIINTVPEEVKTKEVKGKSQYRAIEEKTIQSWETQKKSENLRMSLRCKKKEYQILQKEKDKKTFGHYIGETYKGSLLDNLISEKLIRCNEIDIKTSKAWKSKPVYIRNANFFKDSLFYQIVEKNYINCLKMRGDFDENEIGKGFKKRDYRILQDILKKEKNNVFYRGDMKCIGQCNNEVYTGSILDKLIAESLIRCNIEYAEKASGDEISVASLSERQKIKSEIDLIIPIIVIDDDLSEFLISENDGNLSVKKESLKTDSKESPSDTSKEITEKDLETDTVDLKDFVDENLAIPDLSAVESVDRLSLSESEIDKNEITISVESIDMQICSDKTNPSDLEIPHSLSEQQKVNSKREEEEITSDKKGDKSTSIIKEEEIIYKKEEEISSKREEEKISSKIENGINTSESFVEVKDIETETTEPETVFIKPLPKFETSAFYQSIVAKYGECMKRESINCKSKTGIEFKTRNYKILRKLVNQQRSVYSENGKYIKCISRSTDEMYKGSNLDKLISESLIRCKEGNVKATRNMKSKIKDLKNENKFQNSFLYQMIEENYVKCLKMRNCFDEGKCLGKEFKKRDYKILQEILERERLYCLNKGNIKGFGKSYKGSVLEKLIAESYTRFNNKDNKLNFEKDSYSKSRDSQEIYAQTGFMNPSILAYEDSIVLKSNLTDSSNCILSLKDEVQISEKEINSDMYPDFFPENMEPLHSEKIFMEEMSFISELAVNKPSPNDQINLINEKINLSEKLDKIKSIDVDMFNLDVEVERINNDRVSGDSRSIVDYDYLIPKPKPTESFIEKPLLEKEIRLCSEKENLITDQTATQAISVKSPPKSKKSLFLQSVAKRYAEIIKKEIGFREGINSMGFKKRSYEMLRKIINQHTPSEISSGKCRHNLIHCIDHAYKGSLLERLIDKSLARDNKSNRKLTSKKSRLRKLLQESQKGLKKDKFLEKMCDEKKLYWNQNLQTFASERDKQLFKGDIEKSELQVTQTLHDRLSSKFEDSIIYQSAVAKYEECMNTQMILDEHRTGIVFKNRDYHILRNILKKQRSKKLCKGSERHKFGLCLHPVYTGSLLEKLIVKSLIKNKVRITIKNNASPKSFSEKLKCHKINTISKIDSTINDEYKKLECKILKNPSFTRKENWCKSEKSIKRKEKKLTMLSSKFEDIKMISEYQKNKESRNIYNPSTPYFQYMNAINPQMCTTPMEKSKGSKIMYNTLPEVSHSTETKELFGGDVTDNFEIKDIPIPLKYRQPVNEIKQFINYPNYFVENSIEISSLMRERKEQNLVNQSYSNKFGCTRFIFDYNKTAKDRLIKLNFYHSFKMDKPSEKDCVEGEETKLPNVVQITMPDSAQCTSGETSKIDCPAVSQKNLDSHEGSLQPFKEKELEPEAVIDIYYSKSNDVENKDYVTKIKTSYDETSTDTSKIFDESSIKTNEQNNVVFVTVCLEEHDNNLENQNLIPLSDVSTENEEIQEINPSRNENEIISHIHLAIDASLNYEGVFEYVSPMQTTEEMQGIIIRPSCSRMPQEEEAKNFMLEGVIMNENDNELRNQNDDSRFMPNCVLEKDLIVIQEIVFFDDEIKILSEAQLEIDSSKTFEEISNLAYKKETNDESHEIIMRFSFSVLSNKEIGIETAVESLIINKNAEESVIENSLSMENVIEENLTRLQELISLGTEMEMNSDVKQTTDQTATYERTSDHALTKEVSGEVRDMIIKSCSSTSSGEERAKNILIECLTMKELELNCELLEIDINEAKDIYNKNNSEITLENNLEKLDQVEDNVINLSTEGWASRFDKVFKQVMRNRHFIS